jgi:hypothetical protein
VTLSYVGTLDRDAVVHAAELVGGLVARREIAAAWTEESSCAGMTVGGLARHLVGQSQYVVRLLSADESPRDDAETLGLIEHYARESWPHEDLDSDANRFVREKSDTQAGEGHDVAVSLQARAIADLPAALADPPGTVFIPWQGWRMPTDDFAVTRLMEMVVHSDDLAASVGVPAPDFGPAVLEPVLALLAGLAVVRHGQDAVVRALTRPQRAPASIAAF